MVQRYGAFSVLICLRKSTSLLRPTEDSIQMCVWGAWKVPFVSLFGELGRYPLSVCLGSLEGTLCQFVWGAWKVPFVSLFGELGRYPLSVRVYGLLNTGLNCYTWTRTGCQNKRTTCKLTWNWMAHGVGHLDWGTCCVNLALVLFGCKRVLGIKGPFWQFSRNDSVMILTKSGLLLLTAMRDFVCMHHLNPT